MGNVQSLSTKMNEQSYCPLLKPSFTDHHSVAFDVFKLLRGYRPANSGKDKGVVFASIYMKYD